MDFQIDEEGFPICKSNTKGKGSDHSSTGGHYRHAPEMSKMIFKYPAEEVSVGELKKRWESKSKEGDYRLYCVPPEPDTGLIKWEGKEYHSFPSLLYKLGERNSKGNYIGGQTRAFNYFIEKFVSESESDMEKKLEFKYKDSPEFSTGNKSNNGDECFDKKILKYLSSSNNVIIEGVAGSGKSHLLESLRRVYCKQEANSKVTYWVAPEKSKKDSEEDIKRKEHEVENKRNEGFSPLYGENGSQLEVVVFHPSTSYEEFVSGIRPNFMKEEGEGDFVSQEGVFVDMCNRAAVNPDKKYLLFIDEINRANTSRVFGDLMLVIEDSKRVDFSKLQTISSEGEGDSQSAEGKESEEKVKEPEIINLGSGALEDGQIAENNEKLSKGFRYGALFSSKATIPSSKDGKNAEYVRLQTPIVKHGIEFNKLVVPANLHVLGTMNTTDRSVGTIDLALRRRFHWVTQHPYTATELKEAMEKVEGIYPEEVATWYEKTNKILLEEVGPDARLGHAYFFGKEGDAEAIAEALIAQLLEIIFTFNIKEDVLKKIGLPELKVYSGKKLDYEGKGLGRRPVVKNLEASGKSSKNDPGADSGNERSESSDPKNGQGNQ